MLYLQKLGLLVLQFSDEKDLRKHNGGTLLCVFKKILVWFKNKFMTIVVMAGIISKVEFSMAIKVNISFT